MKIDDIIEAMKQIPKVENRFDVLVLSKYQYDQLKLSVPVNTAEKYSSMKGTPIDVVERHEYYDVVMTHLLSGKKVAIWQNETSELVIFKSTKQGEQNDDDPGNRDFNPLYGDDSSKAHLPFTKGNRHRSGSFPYFG